MVMEVWFYPQAIFFAISQVASKMIKSDMIIISIRYPKSVTHSLALQLDNNYKFTTLWLSLLKLRLSNGG